MGLTTHRGVDTNPPPRWNPIDTSGVSSTVVSNDIFGLKEEIVRNKLQEVRFGIHREKNKERGGEEKPPKPKTSGFEPFVDANDPLKPPEQNGVLFVNYYNGNYAQKMMLNRMRVEKALQIAHLDGQVFLTSLVSSRQRSAEVQGNELAAKRNLFFGEKIKKDQEENPLSRVVSVPEGWRIEINDTKLTEELTGEKKLAGQELQKAFVKQFSLLLKKGLHECAWREKLSLEKDEDFRAKLRWDIVISAISVMPSAPFLTLTIDGLFFVLAVDLGLICLGYGMSNAFFPNRKFDHSWECFMPSVEIDKVVRTFTYLSVKGRTLVKETREENKNPE